MTDPVIRPGNGLLLIALQSAEGVPASPSAATDVILVETDSVEYNDPYRTEATNEATGSFDAGPPLIIGQPATFNFRSRLRGAGIGATYTSSLKPPLHATLSACGFLGQFTASVSAAALTAGTATSGTLGTGFSTTAQAYRGMPLILSSAPAAGRVPLVTDYSAAKVATLSDSYGSALSTVNQAALPPNWTYAPTTPVDSASRATMHPCATIYWYEDGTLRQLYDCRGVMDLEGNTARPGFGVFNFTGIYGGISDAAMPSNPVFASHAAPFLVQGSGTGPVAQLNRRGLPISKWSIKSNSQVTSPDDPNTPIGYGSGQLADRMYVLEVDPLRTLVATRNAIAEIGAFSQYPASLQFGTVAGNRVSILMPLGQPTDTAPTMRDKLRAETLHVQALNPGKDSAGRDGSVILCYY